MYDDIFRFNATLLKKNNIKCLQWTTSTNEVLIVVLSKFSQYDILWISHGIFKERF